MASLESRIFSSLEKRKDLGLFRSISDKNHLIDFSSNDYLGLSIDTIHQETTKQLVSNQQMVGSTGSRLLSGESAYLSKTESIIANFHDVEAALLFSSGFMANIGLLGTVIRRGDLVFYDELSHSSIRVGLQLSKANCTEFRHNDLQHLLDLLSQSDHTKVCFVVVESVYSMDGDEAPLLQLVELKQNYPNLHIIVDEAHSIGVTGKQGEGLVKHLKLAEFIFAQVVTYGKAMGTHGAAVLGSQQLKSYLLNFAKSQIYTTAMSNHTAATIRAAYDALERRADLHSTLRKNKKAFESLTGLQSPSAIYSVLVPGNSEVISASLILEKHGFDVRPIRYPTVARGSERLRINIHAHNTHQEIENLVKTMISKCRITFDIS